MRELRISADEGGQRVDKYISKRFRTMPKSLLYKYLRKERIKLNGKKTKPDDFVREGDVIKLYIPDEFFEAEVRTVPPPEKDTRLSIVYEDANILIADKEAGLLCHSDRSESSDTLIDRIKAYLAQKGEYNPDSAFAPALCNRLDRNTAGLVTAAKTGAALRDMNARLRERLVERRYLAAVRGTPAPPKGTLRGFLRKDRAENRVYISSERRFPDEKEAVTEYTVLKSSGGVSLVEIELVTGRTHQIRAQFAYAGWPLLHDRKYGGEKGNKREQGYCPLALCAYKIKFLPAGNDSLSYLDGKVFRSLSGLEPVIGLS